MHHLLDAIVSVKSPPDTNVYFNFEGKPTPETLQNGENYVIKTHAFKFNTGVWDYIQQGKVSVFASAIYLTSTKGGIWTHSLHIQTRQDAIDALSCSLCEVQKYQQIFNMTNEEVERVADYIETYSIIRRCCGLQMSIWERKRLHGCNITKEEKELDDYPNCERIDKYEMELKLANSEIKHRLVSSDFNWKKVGDCKKFDDVIQNGQDFNGKEFTDCDAILS